MNSIFMVGKVLTLPELRETVNGTKVLKLGKSCENQLFFDVVKY